MDLLHYILKQTSRARKIFVPTLPPWGGNRVLSGICTANCGNSRPLLNATQVVFAPETFNPLLRAAKKLVASECCANIQERFLYMAPIFITIFEGIFYISSPCEYVNLVSPKQVLEFCGSLWYSAQDGLVSLIAGCQ